MSVKPFLEVQTCKEVHPSLLIKRRVAGVASSSQGWQTETGHLELPVHLKWGPSIGIKPRAMWSSSNTTIPPHEEVQLAKIRGNSCAGDAYLSLKAQCKTATCLLVSSGRVWLPLIVALLWGTWVALQVVHFLQFSFQFQHIFILSLKKQRTSHTTSLKHLKIQDRFFQRNFKKLCKKETIKIMLTV